MNNIRWTIEQAAIVASAEAWEVLTVRGLPENTIVCESKGIDIDAIRIVGGRRLVPIGRFDEDFLFYLDLDSGEVFFAADWDDAPSMVNKTLGAFVESLVMVEESYPFYAAGASMEERSEVAREIRGRLELIDSSDFLGPGTFWSDFVHDVSIGDYASE